jgi:hypothetical protein
MVMGCQIDGITNCLKTCLTGMDFRMILIEHFELVLHMFDPIQECTLWVSLLTCAIGQCKLLGSMKNDWAFRV